VPIRIYSLAKDLKVDSKDLVEICAKAGITGKGSALASLTDEELDRVKAFMAGGQRRPAAQAPVPPPSMAATLAAPPPAAAPPLRPAAAPAAFTRDDYIAPAGAGKPRLIVGKGDKKAAFEGPERKEKKDLLRPGGKPSQRREPVVRLGAIPEPPQTTPAAKKDEPAPQKPIMTLPADAIRNAKSGSRAPLEQFTKHQDKKRERDREAPPRPPVRTAPEPEDAAARAARERRGKAKVAPPDEAGEDRDKKLAAMAGSRTARQQKRRRTQVTPGADDEETEVRRRRRRLQRKGGTNTAAPRKGRVVLPVPCTVRGMSEATGVPTAAIQRALLQIGQMATINQELDEETAELIAADLQLDIEFKQAETLEDQLLTRFETFEDQPEDLQTRPPVITFLGHVDHGKTSLLDRIIGINVVSGEAGGITQHIRAYRLSKDGRAIAFVDTPGHEAFTEMRARGAHVTDIAVLVVAADDGVMPQTEEAISHARAAEVPIVVALNKCDLPGVDFNRVLQELSTHGLLPAEWGGDVEVVKTSALTGEGIDTLLETLLLTADLHEYRANPKRPAMGTCLEAEQQGNQGVVAKVIVQNGTLSVGDIIVCGGAHGRVKAMYDTLEPRKKVNQVGPSTPVNLVGLDIAPEAGEPFYEMDDIAEARQVAEQRRSQSRSRSLSGRNVRVSFEEFQRRLEEGRLGDRHEVTVLNLIVRADVRGSIEAIQKELEKLHHPEVQVRILQAAVGGVTSADVTLADASDAVIVGFNVIPDEDARSLADERGVEIRRYEIIYKMTEDLKLMLEGKLKPEERVTDLGRALVQQVFTISRVGTVAGCRVLGGTIERGCRIRVNRNGRGIGDYALDSLRREKDDVKEVREGFECGMRLAGFNDLKEGDILEAYKIEEFARTL
jgi:translation initiation factor IF-2